MAAKKRWDKTFTQRLEKRYDEMKWLYEELYHGYDGAFDYFLSMLYRNYKERKKELKDLDRKREDRPDWYREDDLVGMLMYTQCFASDLKGVKKHLNYIQECGVNYLHLMPLLQSPAGRSDGGYAVSDFRSVEPALGTMKDLEALLPEMAGLRAVCDEAETLTAASYWPFPTYGDLLFGV